MPADRNEPLDSIPARAGLADGTPGQRLGAAAPKSAPAGGFGRAVSATALLPVGLAATFVVIIWVGVGLTLWHERSRALEEGQSAAANLAQVLEEQTVRTFQAVDLTLVGLIDTLHHAPLMPDHDPAFEDTMRQKLKALPYVRALFVIGPDGFITQDTDHPFTPRVTLADRPYFKAHQNDPDLGLHMSSPLVSRSVDRWFVSLSRRIEKPGGGFGGIVVAAVEPRYFERFYETLRLGADDSIALWQSDGTLMARNPHRDELIGRSFADSVLFRRYRPESSNGTYRIETGTLENAPHIVGYRTVRDLPLVVAVTLDEQSLLGEWRRNTAAAIIACVVMAALTAALTVLFLRHRRQRDEAQQWLAQAQKMEALGQMTGGIAHDFNNLLGAILGFAGLLRDDLPASSEQQLFATRILQTCARGKDLIRQLLAFAQARDVERRLLDLRSVLDGARDLLNASLPSSTTLKIEAEAEVLPIRADEGQLHQLLLNLCLNANDALGGEPGTITIRLARMRPERSPLTIGDLRLGRDYARLTVADTGAGIDMATLPRIFEPFFTTKERGRGTGLGLAVVHGIVTASGGALHVESVPGTGTTFTIYLPLADSSPRPETASRPSPGEVRGRERILIVDDEPDLADMLAIGLERLGYEVASSNESREALQAFREDPTAWDVLVADQVMPGLKGTALIAAVKRLRPDLKAILHTGFGDGVTDTAARAQGADAVLHKPVEAQQVAACIRRLLDARETLRMC